MDRKNSDLIIIKDSFYFLIWFLAPSTGTGRMFYKKKKKKQVTHKHMGESYECTTTFI